MIEPIKPSEIKKFIPEFIIKGANECIQDHYHELKRSSKFTQDELIEYVLKYAPEEVTRANIFDNNWLDIEPTYRKAGWKVIYDGPAYCENYPATFTFYI